VKPLRALFVTFLTLSAFGGGASPVAARFVDASSMTLTASIDTIPVQQGECGEDTSLVYAVALSDGDLAFMDLPYYPDDPADEMYQRGRAALSGGDFQEAANIFAEVIRKYPKSSYVPDATYWQAYALFNMGEENYQRALKLLDTHLSKYPKASTRKHAQDLRSRVVAALAESGDPSATQEVRKNVSQTQRSCEEQVSESAAALVALQNMAPDSVIGPLKKLFARRDKCSLLLRRQAITIVPAGSEVMNDLIVEVAATDPDPEVRSSAYAMLSQIPSTASIEVLGNVLKTAPDDARKEEALNSLASNRNATARKMIRDFIMDADQPEELRGKAIQSLATPPYAQPYFGEASVDETARVAEILKENGALLRETYPKLKADGLKKGLVLGLISLGGAENRKVVFDVIASKTEPIDYRRELLTNITYSLGDNQLLDTHPKPFASADDLVPLYDRLSDRSMRETLIGIFAAHSDETAPFEKLASIALKEPNKNLRGVAITGLANSKNPKAAAVLSEIVNQQKP
jgi:tetratricopeptide (TPR) repeat protein